MVKNFLLLILVLFAIIFFLLNLCQQSQQQSRLPRNIPSFGQPDKIHIKSVNQNYDKIRSLSGKLLIYVKGVKLNGDLYLEKDRNFRLMTHSIMGLESDIGSNNQYFWFWSKRMSPPVLFYAKYENLQKTNLRSPFNPFFMMESLCVYSVHGPCFEYKNNIISYNREISPNGETMTRIILIDPIIGKIIGNYLYNSENTLICFSEVEEFQTVNRITVPKKIRINWCEERISMTWIFQDTEINRSIDKKLWNIPNMKNKREIGL